MTVSKLKRGQKRCKKCGEINAARSQVCKGCNERFISKNTPLKNEVKDWTTLEKGDQLKVVQGTGPYFICSRDNDEGNQGDKIYMGARGVYKVISLREDGIIAYGISKKNGGYDFIYMGGKSYCHATGITKAPHRIIKMKPKRRR